MGGETGSDTRQRSPGSGIEPATPTGIDAEMAMLILYAPGPLGHQAPQYYCNLSWFNTFNMTKFKLKLRLPKLERYRHDLHGLMDDHANIISH